MAQASSTTATTTPARLSRRGIAAIRLARLASISRQSTMTNISADTINGGQSSVPLIERRQGQSSAHRMSIDLPQPNFLCVPYPNDQQKLEAVPPAKELPQRKNQSGFKSRMDPEFQELKGFTELGFEFSKDQLTPRVLILLPGLKRLIDHEKSKKMIGFQPSALEKSELPNSNAAGMDLKEHLKLWARSVASTLKGS